MHFRLCISGLGTPANVLTLVIAMISEPCDSLTKLRLEGAFMKWAGDALFTPHIPNVSSSRASVEVCRLLGKLPALVDVRIQY